MTLLDESDVMARSEEHVAYCHLNEHIRRPRELEKRGRRLDALLTAVGDIASCYVSSWNPSGSVIFLERYERGSREAAMIDTIHDIRHPDINSSEGMYSGNATPLLRKLDERSPLRYVHLIEMPMTEIASVGFRYIFETKSNVPRIRSWQL
ncbi:hypothetical protein Pmar_PMAR019890 [Perkinsus marinus ATCC 50983]|uniref:Uncharacterized protein n=1 Tax=Perkinsus marinus (strain ATCC 50983 / TXsc) TaxID=423536 RepID=C5KBX7_PERM5|nr:hypothetical protein Pmar_PMAR019890 [Perkinsus marinus ATCC 50983]EER18008.1 hypothetical protein Pmar_PMAR019890 [Perkinsus marinus ATCC 50983]|eukprot:XP_002786212.1 hypothetical protein Pmar_PMAR019890 [Perkinsus marinus ATCC 50983]